MKWIILLVVLLGITSVYAQVDERIQGLITQSLTQQIEESIICGNGICQEGENHLNCPDDCEQQINELNIFMIILFIGVIYLALRRKK